MKVRTGTTWEGDLYLRGPQMRDGNRYGSRGERVRARITKVDGGCVLERSEGNDAHGQARWVDLIAGDVYVPSYIEALIEMQSRATG
jgi:hypothetical protein